jgi:hypothetical protein
VHKSNWESSANESHLYSELNFFNPANETLFNVGNSLAQCELEAHSAHTALGDSLYAFEIENEVDDELSSQLIRQES